MTGQSVAAGDAAWGEALRSYQDVSTTTVETSTLVVSISTTGVGTRFGIRRTHL
jgi:hypothetical protein